MAAEKRAHGGNFRVPSEKARMEGNEKKSTENNGGMDFNKLWPDSRVIVTPEITPKKQKT